MKTGEILEKIAILMALLLTAAMFWQGMRMLPPYSGEQWVARGIASAGSFCGVGLGLIALAVLLRRPR